MRWRPIGRTRQRRAARRIGRGEGHMGMLARRGGHLEEQGTASQGGGMWGVRRVHHERGTGPDAVRVGVSDEYITEAEFRQRYPHGVLIHALYYSEDDPPAPEAG